MAVRTQKELFDELEARVRSNGVGGKTTAEDLRQIFRVVIDEVLARDVQRERPALRIVADRAERDAIALADRQNLMEVKVEADGVTYELVRGLVDSSLESNTNWRVLGAGGYVSGTEIIEVTAPVGADYVYAVKLAKTYVASAQAVRNVAGFEFQVQSPNTIFPERATLQAVAQDVDAVTDWAAGVVLGVRLLRLDPTQPAFAVLSLSTNGPQ